MARKTPSRKPATRKQQQPGRPSPLEGPTFGPHFFTEVLPRMVQVSPCPPDQENACVVYLGDGERLDVAEILAAAERFVVLAVFDDGAGVDGVPRTDDDVGFEAVPYELVLRVAVRPAAKRGRFGFHFPHEALAAAAAATPVLDVTPNGAAPANGAGGEQRPARKKRRR